MAEQKDMISSDGEHTPSCEYIPYRRLWASVVLEQIRESIEKDRSRKKNKDFIGTLPVDSFRKWANSKDGRMVLSLAGFEHSKLVVDRLCQRVLDDVMPKHMFTDGYYRDKGIERKKKYEI